MNNNNKKSEKNPIKIFSKASINASIKKKTNFNKNENGIISYDNNKNKKTHEIKLKEIELLEKELHNIESQNELILKNMNSLKDKQNNLLEKLNKINDSYEKENNELNELKETNKIKNKEYFQLLHLRIQQQISNSIDSNINIMNNIIINNANIIKN